MRDFFMGLCERILCQPEENYIFLFVLAGQIFYF